ncbi:MAG: DUF2191 domain-containing protein [Calditrichia bacterium]
MKVTALIPDKLIAEVKSFSRGRNITESLIIALNEWVALQKIKQLNFEIKKQPLEFREGFEGFSIREINRK